MQKTEKHKLETPWTFWIDKRSAFNSKEQNAKEGYLTALTEIGTFSTIEDFWAYQFNIATVDKFPVETELHCFRKGIKPAWESLPEGGSWNLRFRKTTFRVTLWEDLLLSTIGEGFEEPEVVGICLSIRPKDDCISVWFRSATSAIKSSVENSFRRILNLDNTVALEFKSHAVVLKQVRSHAAHQQEPEKKPAEEEKEKPAEPEKKSEEKPEKEEA